MSSLFKRMVSYFVGNMSSKLVAVVLIPIYAYYVTKEDLGNYDYLITLTNIIVPIAFINIWDAVLKYTISENDTYQKKKVTVNAYIVLCVGVLVTIAIYGFLYIIKIVEIKNFVISVLLLVSYGICTFYQYMCRAYQNNSLYTKSSIIGSVENIIFVVIFVIILGYGFIGLVISYMISLLTISLMIEKSLKLIKGINLKLIDMSLIKRMLRFSAPLTINTISLWLTSGISKIIVVKCISAEANGIYSFANRFAAMVTIVSSIVGMALIEEAYTYKDVQEYRDKFQKIISKLIHYYFSMVGVAIPVISIAFFLFRNTEYNKSLELIPIFLIIAVFSSLSTVVGITFSVVEKTQYIFVTSMIAAFVNILIGVVLVDKFSYYGIILGQLCGNIVMFVVRVAFSYHYARVKINFGLITISTILALVVGVISVEIEYILNVFLLAFVLTVVAFWNRKDLKNIYDKVRRKTKNVH